MKAARVMILNFGLALLFSVNLFAQVKQVGLPNFFKTLVNPPCSHCIDESKRRAGELRSDERVLAWIRGKYDGGAVPFRFFLVPYRVISDTYGVWVYDADAGFIRGYEPSLDFVFHGWRNGVMVIQHKDGTLFSALSGVAFEGPRKGTALVPLPIIQTDWGYWLNAYPKTVAYEMFAKYVPQDMPVLVNSESVSTRPAPDKRLDSDEPVIGIAIGNRAKAYPISLLAARNVIRDKVGDQEVVVLWFAPTKTAAIYAPRMENEKIPEHLKLEANPQISTAPFMDKETFSHWTVEGRAVEGPLKGKTLAWLPGVQCKWFAWAAEYPATDIYSPSEKRAETVEPLTAKLIAGERLDWDKLVKTTGYVLKKGPSAKSLTIFTDHDKKAHELLVTSQTEIHVGGAWGTMPEFAPNQSVYLLATTDGKTNLVAVHAITDDISLQAMSRPYVLKEYDQRRGRMLLVDAQGRRAPLDLQVNRKTKFLTQQSGVIQSGSQVYCNMARQGSGLTATEVFDTASFDARRKKRLELQQSQLTRKGLTGTVLEVDRTNHQIGVMVRRADAWFARCFKVNGAVQISSKTCERTGCAVAAVHPDYSRVRIRLECPVSALSSIQAGDELALFARLPDKIDFETPPDLGRFTERQERIDYLLSTIYCPCGMMGDSCAGHWNTLAACKLHGCGMPNLISKLAGQWIEAGRTDEAILGELVQQYGRNVLKIHQN